MPFPDDRGQDVIGSKGSLEQLPLEKEGAINQIRTVIGHSKGIEEMIENRRYCVNILKQIAAVQSSLNKLSHTLTKDYMRVCMKNAIGGDSGEEMYRTAIKYFLD